MNEVLNLLNDKTFLDSLYGFAYTRTNNSYEAEDLCSDIILSVLSSARKNSDINNPYAFAWTIARRVYADFSGRRKNTADTFIKAEYAEYLDNAVNIYCDSIGEYFDAENDKIHLRRIMREICFLSKIYRDVCVMYYLDEMKISDIAKSLEITESAVKQRLYSARESIKKEVEKMEKIGNGETRKIDINNLPLKPVDIIYWGTGNPVGNDPRTVAGRGFSKNLIYLCKDTERGVKELSDMLQVPAAFVEEEVEIQTKGQNGYYGLLKKTENGKYITNFILIDYDDYMTANEMYKKNSDIIARKIDEYIKKSERKILELPFLSKQTDVRFISWLIISKINWAYRDNIGKKLAEKYFSDIAPTNRNFFTFGIALEPGTQFDTGFYGCDGIFSNDICGYRSVHMSNIYGGRIQKHFHCGHDISQDAQLILTIKSINGISMSSLSEDEKETAAKAIESGYIRREKGNENENENENDILYPAIVVIEKDGLIWDIAENFVSEINDLIESVADKAYKYIKKYVPKRLMGEYNIFNTMTSACLFGSVIEKCIELGALVPPEKTPSAEGILMVVTK